MQALPLLCRTRPAVLIMAMACALVGCSPKPPSPPDIPSVYVSTVSNDSGSAQRVLFGSVRPRVEAELGFRVGGRITARLVDLGQTVRAGQPLARIDPADYQLAVQAAAEQQRAAAVDAVQAASDAARLKRLLAEGSVAAADVERQQARADAAEARLAQTLKQSELANNRAGYSVLLAPFDGVVTSVRFEVGQMVDDSRPVLSLARPNELEVQVDVPESMVVGLKTWKASARVGGAPDAPVPLRLRELAPSAAPATRTYRARYAFTASKPNAGLRMGMSAEVQLQQSGLAASAELPISALLVTATAEGGRAAGSVAVPSVWVVDATTGVIARRSVQLLSQTTDRVRVAGLADGAYVVTVGAQKLDSGLKVLLVHRPLGSTNAPANQAAVR